MRIHIAARFDGRLDALRVAADLMRAGHHVTSRWIEGGPNGDSARAGDIDDLRRADYLVTFSERPEQPAAATGAVREDRRVELDGGLSDLIQALRPPHTPASCR